MLRMKHGGRRGPEHGQTVAGLLRQLAVPLIVTAVCTVAGLGEGQAVAAPYASNGDDSTVQDAREALRVRDKARLLADRDAVVQARHPLAPWVDYWYFQLRLMEMGPTEVDEFLGRWPDAYVADRARNDWLIELGRRKDWRTFLRIQPTFRMNDDREVSCLGLLARQQSGLPMEGPGEWREQARQAWWGQKDADYGCDAMAQALLAAGILEPSDVWRKLRLVIENDRPRAVQQSAKLLGEQVAQAVDRLMGQAESLLHPDTGRASLGAASGGSRASGHSPGAVIGPAPARSKTGKNQRKDRLSAKDKARARSDANLAASLGPWPTGLTPQMQSALNLLAFIRWTGQDPTAAATALDQPGARERWGWAGEETAWALAQVGRSLAWRLQPQAPLYFERAVAEQALALGASERRTHGANGSRLSASWSADALAWMARSGLRAAVAAPAGPNGVPPSPIGAPAAWTLVEQAIEAMSPEQQQDPAWLYWKAKAVQHLARKASNHTQAEAHKKQALELLQRVANPLTFYGQLASEELLGAPARPPVAAAPVTEAELTQARATPGVDRALRMLELGMRGEAVREWNFTLSYTKPGGLSDRELLAVAEEACRREVWDRCINSSERTRNEVSLAQRYPTPYRDDVLSAARQVGLDAAYMYGLIRQESRFIVAAKSNVGASGLMQVMPGTAAWTARKLQIDYHPDRIADRVTNLRIGAGYLKLLVDDFQGMQALAAAAYNAGPSRPRRWREGSKLDAAAWVENIPFNETRDYVKKVLSNAVVYAHLIDGKPLSLKARLGATVGPRAGSAPPEEGDLP
jgi:soluble lytic murein transglycosylase